MEIGRPIIDRRFLYVIYKLENYNVELDYTCYHTTYDYIILIMIVLIATPESKGSSCTPVREPGFGCRIVA